MEAYPKGNFFTKVRGKKVTMCTNGVSDEVLESVTECEAPGPNELTLTRVTPDSDDDNTKEFINTLIEDVAYIKASAGDEE